MPTEPRSAEGVRVRPGNVLAVSVSSLVSGVSLGFRGYVEYDDGEPDVLDIATFTVGVGTNGGRSLTRARKNGTLYGIQGYSTGGTQVLNCIYVQVLIITDDGINAPNVQAFVFQGYADAFQEPQIGAFEPKTRYATWVFQGTVAEDATAGTHICTLTIVPGAGNELQFLYGRILEGNTATAQRAIAQVTDAGGADILVKFLDITDTAANIERNVPSVGAPVANTSSFTNFAAPGYFVSGTMQLTLQVNTAAVSVTQTFAVVCKIRGNALPTATLADTVGTPTLTVNTNAVFG